MGSEIITFFVVALILAIIGFIVWLTYNYITFKQDISVALLQTTKDINKNFDVTTSNLDIVREATEYNIDDIINTSNSVLHLSAYSSNSSNVISGKINNYFENNDTNFSTFNNNINRYFQFNDGNTNISSGSTNNKIFDYIFGTSIPNLDLITKTTAVGGLTINSDVGKELKICNTVLDTNGKSKTGDKCIKMTTDLNGKFNISPAGTSNIQFQDDLNATILNIDTKDKAIYLGGNDVTNSAMYITNGKVYANDIYMNNLYLRNTNANTQTPPEQRNYRMSYNDNVKHPVSVFFNIYNSTVNSDVLSIIIITVSLPENVSIKNKTLNINSNNLLKRPILSRISKKVNDENFQNSDNSNYIQYFVSFGSLTIDQPRTAFIEKMKTIMNVNNSSSAASDISLSFETTDVPDIIIPTGCKIILFINYQGVENLTKLENTINHVFSTETYLIPQNV